MKKGDLITVTDEDGTRIGVYIKKAPMQGKILVQIDGDDYFEIVSEKDVTINERPQKRTSSIMILSKSRVKKGEKCIIR